MEYASGGKCCSESLRQRFQVGRAASKSPSIPLISILSCIYTLLFLATVVQRILLRLSQTT